MEGIIITGLLIAVMRRQAEKNKDAKLMAQVSMLRAIHIIMIGCIIYEIENN